MPGIFVRIVLTLWRSRRARRAGGLRYAAKYSCSLAWKIVSRVSPYVRCFPRKVYTR